MHNNCFDILSDPFVPQGIHWSTTEQAGHYNWHCAGKWYAKPRGLESYKLISLTITNSTLKQYSLLCKHLITTLRHIRKITIVCLPVFHNKPL